MQQDKLDKETRKREARKVEKRRSKEKKRLLVKPRRHRLKKRKKPAARGLGKRAPDSSKKTVVEDDYFAQSEFSST